jgi:hypothetical protein
MTERRSASFDRHMFLISGGCARKLIAAIALGTVALQSTAALAQGSPPPSAPPQNAIPPTAELATYLASLKATLDLTVQHCRGNVDGRIKADYGRYASAFPSEFATAEAARVAELKAQIADQGAYKFCLMALEQYGPRGKVVRGAWKLG